MATGRKIKIKMKSSELEALMMAYQGSVRQMEHEARTEHYTQHETLLLEHATTMRDKLERLNERGQLKYTLTLTNIEAMAFYQLWQRQFGINTYCQNGVRKVYDEIDQKHKSAVWIIK